VRLLVALALLGAAQSAPESGFRLSGAQVQGGLLRGVAPAGTAVLTLDGRDVPMAPDGRFIIGVDRDAAPVLRLVARNSGGAERAETLRIASRSWRIQHINLPRPATGPTPEFQRIREREMRLLGAARNRHSASLGWSQRFIWPVQGRRGGSFGAQRVYRGGVPAAYHSGEDIAAGAGTIVVAPADGVVTLAPPPGFSLEGNLVILDHGLGLTSSFLHLSRASVRPGQIVRRGEPIGAVGATGRATGPHLHWSLLWNGARIDPQAVVASVP
jgi:murein DD-endopeptidase MepM/ murein hydrolase activator NlpD